MTPKHIAKVLGLRRAEVDPIIRAYAARASAVEAALVGCWLSSGWSMGLRWDAEAHPGWNDDGAALDVGGIPSLASALIAREHRYDTVSVCGYIVDPHCLGVKNALGPRRMKRDALDAFARGYFSAHALGFQPAPIELARDLVLGAVDYARQLGFEPHPDFTLARSHLGARQGPSAIEFGYNGEPFFWQGPHDDVLRVLATLNRSVGRGKFGHMLLEDMM